MRPWTLLRKGAMRTAIAAYETRVVRALVQSVVPVRRPEGWVFILGCYNSGTTLLESLVGAHPACRTLPREGARLATARTRPEDLGWTRMWIGCPDYVGAPGGGSETVEQVLRDWSPWWGRGGSVFLEKSISNLLRVDWLAEHFPGASFIGITRDGYAVAEGIRRRARPRGPVAERFGEEYPLDMAARQWVDANRRLAAVGERTDLRYVRVAYEDLIAEPVEVMSSLFAFLGLQPPVELRRVEDGVLVADRAVPLFNGNERSFGRLSVQDLEVITREISDMQLALGYPLRGPA